MSTAWPIGVTGGAASGKSTVARELARLLGASLFDADACVHELFTRPAIRERIEAAFPGSVEDGHIVRAVLRERILQNTGARRQLEDILHPAVYAACEQAHRVALSEAKPLVAEIPLLLETQAETSFHPIVLVAASPGVQLARLAGRGLPEADAHALLAAQWSFEKKLPLADYVIWNDGTVAQLEAQVRALATELTPAASTPLL